MLLSPRCSSLVLAVVFLAPACHEDSPGADPTTGSTTESSSSSGTSSDTGGQANREICDRYLGCVSVVAPGELPTAQMGFGENGTCWQGSEQDAQLCLDACRSGLETFNEAFPEEEKCAVCQEHAECDMAGGELCHLGKCTVTTCGDGIVDPEDVCDSQPGCNSDCLGPPDCNPFSNYGCLQDEHCAIRPKYLTDEHTTTQCLTFVEDAVIEQGKPCGVSMGTCDVGLGCASPSFVPWCDPGAGTGCCTQLCMLDAPQCEGDEKCVPYQDVSGRMLTPELSYVGFCIPA